MAVTFYIDVENAAGTKLGSGPIVSARNWRYTARQDQAGAISFEVPASDPKAIDLLTYKRVVRAYAHVGNAWIDIGAGTIDNLDWSVDRNGITVLKVSGDDLLGELNNRSAGFLEIGAGGTNNTYTDTKAAIAGILPDGWTVDDSNVSSVPQSTIYARFAGENTLAAVKKLCAAHQIHFRRGNGRTLELYYEPASPRTVRAIQAHSDLADGQTAIVDLQRSITTYDLITRIYPYGAGQGQARLTLKPTTKSAPAGYTLDKTNNYIESTAATAEYGLIERHIEFKTIAPISNTSADLRAASDMLFELALDELKQRTIDIVNEVYALKLAQADALLRPGDRVRATYRDLDSGIDVDGLFYVLESTIEIDAGELRTTDVTIASVDRWPKTDNDELVARLEQGSVFQAHPQLNGNSYVLPFTKNLDHEYSASFRFRLGAEVVQLQQALFEFQILPFESTVRSVGGESVTTDAGGGTTATSTNGGASTPTTSAGGSSTPTTSAGGGTTVTSTNGGSSTPTTSDGGGTTKTSTNSGQNHIHVVGLSSGTTGSIVYYNSGVGGFVTSGGGSVETDIGSADHNHNVTIPDHNHTVTIPAHNHDVTIPNHQHTVTIPNHQHTVTIPGHTHDVTIPDHQHTVTPVINPVYGIYREIADRTYDIDHLEYRVNSGDWAPLSGVVSQDGDWYQLDITDAVQDADTLRPIQESNTVEVRAARTGIGISAWSWLDTTITFSMLEAHGLEVGDQIIVEGAATGIGGKNVNGAYTVAAIGGFGQEHQFNVTAATSATDVSVTTQGYVRLSATATIDAQLSVRNIIQAIAYL